MTLDKRLDDLEASLSPDQIWLRFLDEMTSKFSSRAEYMRWVDQDPGERCRSRPSIVNLFLTHHQNP